MAGMLGGLLLDIVGYVGRVQMHYNPFTFNPFLEYLICRTIGPTLLTASIYLCLAGIVMYGEGASRIKPRTYTLVFISCDFLSLDQGGGGGLTATANTMSAKHTWISIMIAGLIFQVVFMLLCTDFAFRLRRYPTKSTPLPSPSAAPSNGRPSHLPCHRYSDHLRALHLLRCGTIPRF
ncbi:hypothetical protein GMDG_07427 [Pseudogymnoascus destructans 20631-21]|uniref:Uncharacterized protein n=2 Tax=Pseudogymnoascus destructans TaxID=655981 RepID=L8FX14_PSED2|nr:hypothetical protein GMDG_07427 [Pseudogymnoascus destructans 20631-21]